MGLLWHPASTACLLLTLTSLPSVGHIQLLPAAWEAWPGGGRDAGPGLLATPALGSCWNWCCSRPAHNPQYSQTRSGSCECSPAAGLTGSYCGTRLLCGQTGLQMRLSSPRALRISWGPHGWPGAFSPQAPSLVCLWPHSVRLTTSKASASGARPAEGAVILWSQERAAQQAVGWGWSLRLDHRCSWAN